MVIRSDSGSWGILRVLKGKNKLAKVAESRQTTRADILDALEAVVIEIADPDLNRQGGRLSSATEYMQSLSDDAEDGPENGAESSGADSA